MQENFRSFTDEELVVDISKGVHSAFAELVQRHGVRFFRVAQRIVQHSQDAEDVVQEAFLQLWKEPWRFDVHRGVKFTTWFYQIITNRALNLIKSKKNTVNEALEELQDESMAIDVKIEEQAKQKMLGAAILSLPQHQQMALNLCFYEEFSNQEAASIMGMSVKALQSLIMRAKNKLRIKLASLNEHNDVRVK
ncbi:MAG: RNA polymerase sigma factor [Alphaproteobacteria bacterium]